MIFEYEKALERFMGEKEILLEVLPDYLESLESTVNKILALNPETDCDQIRPLAHSIKGSSLNLDIVKLGKEAETLEHLAHDGKSAEIPASIKRLTEYAEMAKKEVKDYIS